MNDSLRIARVTRSAEQTRALGAALAYAIVRSASEQPLVIALNGELGAGKTMFVGGFMRALGVTGPVKSPTYTLIEPYEVGSHRVYHLDLYRLADASELEMLALRDLLEPRAVLLVEWAERGQRALPKADVTLTLAYQSDEMGDDLGAMNAGDRVIQIEASSPAGRVLAASLQAMPDETGVSP